MNCTEFRTKEDVDISEFQRKCVFYTDKKSKFGDHFPVLTYHSKSYQNLEIKRNYVDD